MRVVGACVFWDVVLVTELRSIKETEVIVHKSYVCTVLVPPGSGADMNRSARVQVVLDGSVWLWGLRPPGP